MTYSTTRTARGTRCRALSPAQPLALASVFLVLAVMLTGCNTVEGAGRDLQAGGRAVERTAD